MKSPHILHAANNVNRLKENLVNVVDSSAIAAIEAEIRSNVKQLYILGRSHFLFATRQNSRAWRQIISRVYYAAYNVSRAVRLCVYGDFSTDSTDHKRIEELPKDFPNKNTYTNRLSALREDRNLCDYDHTGKITDLVLTSEDALALVEGFLRDSRVYLRARGITL